MFLYLLTISILFILIFSYTTNRRNIFAPSFICSASFLIGSVFLILLEEEWRVTINWETVLVINLGLLSMWFGERFYAYKVSIVPSQALRESYRDVTTLHVSRKFVIVLILINFYVAYTFFKEVMLFMVFVDEWSESMAEYRMAIMTGETSVSRLVSQLRAITTSSTYLFLFILIHNLSKGDSFQNNYLYLIACIPHLIIIFLTGGRIGYLSFAAIILWYVFILSATKYSRYQYVKFVYRFSRKAAIFASLLLLLFFSLRIVMGRANTKERTFTNYIGEYIGAPTLNLDYFLSRYNPPDLLDYDFTRSTAMVGLSSFIYSNSRNMPPKYGSQSMGHREGYGGAVLGNVYTAFARYYADFGYLGIFLFPFILGSLLMKIMSMALNKNASFNKRFIFIVITYALLYNQLVIYAADDTFFGYFRPGNLEPLLLIYFANKYCVKVKYKNGGKENIGRNCALQP